MPRLTPCRAAVLAAALFLPGCGPVPTSPRATERAPDAVKPADPPKPGAEPAKKDKAPFYPG